MDRCPGEQVDCEDKAAAVCVRGYKVAESMRRSGVAMVMAGKVPVLIPTSSGHMLVQCESDDPPWPWPTSPRDAPVCVRDFERESAVRSDLPNRPTFIGICVALPDDVQLCLNPSYAPTHSAACAASIAELSPPLRHEIDRLLVAPTEQ